MAGFFTRLSRLFRPTPPSPLEVEWETYQRIKPGLLDREGEFVVIHGRNVLGIVPTREDALRLGYTRAGIVPFLAHQIGDEEPLATTTRHLD